MYIHSNSIDFVNIIIYTLNTNERGVFMKIEKISDNQIRCTLSHQDLADRELQLSELAYGSDKAKELFRDMMQQASYEFGFEANDIPLMIEAIPISRETLILVITKVDNPDELDNRFSKLSLSSISADSHEDDALTEDDIETEGAVNEKESSLREDTVSDKDTSRLFSFRTLDDIIHVSELTADICSAENSIYKDTALNRYYLLLNQGLLDDAEYESVCSTFLEYGSAERFYYSTHAHLKEYCDLIIKDNALKILSSL